MRAIEYGRLRPRRPSSIHRHFPPGYDQSCIDPTQADVFDLEILIQTFSRAFAAETGFLDAPEGHDLVGEDALVDADHAGVELLGDPPGAGEILAEQVGGKPERRVVGELDGVLLRVEAHQR